MARIGPIFAERRVADGPETAGFGSADSVPCVQRLRKNRVKRAAFWTNSFAALRFLG